MKYDFLFQTQMHLILKGHAASIWTPAITTNYTHDFVYDGIKALHYYCSLLYVVYVQYMDFNLFIF